MRNIFITSIGLGVVYALLGAGIGTLSTEAWARGAILAVLCFALLLTLKAIAAAWRASRRAIQRVNVETVGRAAGELAKAAEAQRDRFNKAFKTTRDA